MKTLDFSISIPCQCRSFGGLGVGWGGGGVRVPIVVCFMSYIPRFVIDMFVLYYMLMFLHL